MSGQRLTEDFVKHHKILVLRAGNTPHNLKKAWERDQSISVSANELDRLWYALEHHRKFSKGRFIVQVHPDFPKAYADYRERWTNSAWDIGEWEREKAGRQTIDAWLEDFLKDLETTKADKSEAVFEEDVDWEFDPDIHSAAKQIEALADYANDRADDLPFFARASEAYKWMSSTVGVDLKSIEAGWREFPVLPIPQHVSDLHGIGDPRSLYGNLNNVRLSYMIGADLAAIAMCRAATEIS